MVNTLETTARWTPKTAVERELVLNELSALLASHHFRNSKRYPALLKYVVRKALDGHSEHLKERTLGVEVFERDPEYDTSADPVVRYSAGEIRKRIAQYYHETGEDGPLQIELPLGSYIPEFKLRTLPQLVAEAESRPHLEAWAPAITGMDAGETASTVPERATYPVEVDRPFWQTWKVWAAVLTVALAALGTYSYWVTHPWAGKDEVWAPLLQTTLPILIVIGSGHPELATTRPNAMTLEEEMHGPQSHISLPSAVALSRVSATLEEHGRPLKLRESSLTNLSDLRSRPVVLVGGLNNPWTLRLLAPLRFSFAHDPLPRIADAEDPGNRSWAVDFGIPVASITRDYAIIARYRDRTTTGNVMVIAGVGPYGTEAASEFVTSPRYLAQLAQKAPKGWENKNLEVVIETDVIAGEAGPPSVVKVATR